MGAIGYLSTVRHAHTYGAREVAEKIRANTTIDWTIRDSARARLMVVVRPTLNKYGYPPDMQAKAIETVMKQAAMMADYVLEE